MIPVVKKFVLVKNVQKADPELADLELHAHVGVEYAEGNGTNGGEVFMRRICCSWRQRH